MCLESGNYWTGLTTVSCSTNGICPGGTVTGACCTQSGCATVAYGNCSGSYKGNYSSCAAPLAECHAVNWSACCTNGGDFGSSRMWQVKTEAQCFAESGEYSGPGVYQDIGMPCSLIKSGACCRDSLCLGVDTQAACYAQDGEYLGDNSTCAFNGQCQVSGQLGSCCVAGQCFAGITQTKCEYPISAYGVPSNHVVFTPGGECESGFCTGAVVGACCSDTGPEVCRVVTQTYCELSNVFSNPMYQGNGTTCEGRGTCKVGNELVGACCNSGVCEEDTQESCTSGGGSYVGNGVACYAALCLKSPAPAAPSTHKVRCNKCKIT
jgi:hypothetical protein